MTVKCLDPVSKSEIASLYQIGISTEELSTTFSRSKRTINRVLVEQGCNRYRAPRQKRDPAQIEIPTLNETMPPAHLHPELTLLEKAVCLLKAVFYRSPENNVKRT